jgi:flagellar protein FliL
MAKDKDPKKDPDLKAGDAEDGEAILKKKGPPMIILIAAAAFVVLAGGGAAVYFLLLAPKPVAAAGSDAHGKKDSHGKKDAKKDEAHGKKDGKDGEKVDPKTQPVITEGPDGITYFTLPDTLSNIQSGNGKESYLKLKLTFECADEQTLAALSDNMPRITDILQGFLSELRPEDLAGSQGNYQLRLEILRRVNLVLAPKKVKAVLIQEMLIS